MVLNHAKLFTHLLQCCCGFLCDFHRIIYVTFLALTCTWQTADTIRPIIVIISFIFILWPACQNWCQSTQQVLEGNLTALASGIIFAFFLFCLGFACHKHQILNIEYMSYMLWVSYCYYSDKNIGLFIMIYTYHNANMVSWYHKESKIYTSRN